MGAGSKTTAMEVVIEGQVEGIRMTIMTEQTRNEDEECPAGHDKRKKTMKRARLTVTKQNITDMPGVPAETQPIILTIGPRSTRCRKSSQAAGTSSWKGSPGPKTYVEL